MIAELSPRQWGIWDWFFPPVCSQCEREIHNADVWFCAQCWVDAPVADSRIAPKTPEINMLRSGYMFIGGNLVQQAVHGLKYHGHRRLAATMARKMAPRLPLPFAGTEVAWTAVPLHWGRQWVRGFNQSELLARELAKVIGHERPIPLLKRVRHTPTQTGRTRRERAANVKDAFQVLSGVHIPKSALIIDDVITTGATVNECARILKSAGVEWVGALSFAQAHP